jgi:hypothetical protein
MSTSVLGRGRTIRHLGSSGAASRVSISRCRNAKLPFSRQTNNCAQLLRSRGDKWREIMSCFALRGRADAPFRKRG